MIDKFSFGRIGAGAASLLATIGFLAFTLAGIEAQAGMTARAGAALACHDHCRGHGQA